MGEERAKITENILFIGPMGSGKSQILEGLVRNHFMGNIIPTTGVACQTLKNLELNGLPCRLLFWDASGNPKFEPTLVPGYLRNHSMKQIFIVLDCTSTNIQNDISKYWELTKKDKNNDAQVHFIFNKTDLEHLVTINETIAKKSIQKLKDYDEKNTKIIFYSAKETVTQKTTRANNPIIQLLSEWLKLPIGVNPEDPSPKNQAFLQSYRKQIQEKGPPPTYRPWGHSFWQWHNKLPTRQKIIKGIKYFLIFALITSLLMGIGGGIGHFAIGAWENSASAFLAVLASPLQGFGPLALGIAIASLAVGLAVTIGWHYYQKNKEKRILAHLESTAESIKEDAVELRQFEHPKEVNKEPSLQQKNLHIKHFGGGKAVVEDKNTGEEIYNGTSCRQQ